MPRSLFTSVKPQTGISDLTSYLCKTTWMGGNLSRGFSFIHLVVVILLLNVRLPCETEKAKHQARLFRERGTVLRLKFYYFFFFGRTIPLTFCNAARSICVCTAGRRGADPEDLRGPVHPDNRYDPSWWSLLPYGSQVGDMRVRGQRLKVRSHPRREKGFSRHRRIRTCIDRSPVKIGDWL